LVVDRTSFSGLKGDDKGIMVMEHCGRGDGDEAIYGAMVVVVITQRQQVKQATEHGPLQSLATIGGNIWLVGMNCGGDGVDRGRGGSHTCWRCNVPNAMMFYGLSRRPAKSLSSHL